MPCSAYVAVCSLHTGRCKHEEHNYGSAESLPRALEEAAQAGGAGSVGPRGLPLGAQREPSGGPAGGGGRAPQSGQEAGQEGPRWRWRLPAQGRQWGEAGGPPAVLEACLDSSYWSPGTQGVGEGRGLRQSAGEGPDAPGRQGPQNRA